MGNKFKTFNQGQSLCGQVSEAEWKTRKNLAAAFRISYESGWNSSIANHITARALDEPDNFL